MSNRIPVFGVSVYPEKTSLEELDAYFKKVSECGFSKVFTSMFSVEDSDESVIAYFTDFCERAHRYGLQVTADVNGAFLERFKIDPQDPVLLNTIGIDCIRFDLPFFDQRDRGVVLNRYGIIIEHNAMMKDLIVQLVGDEDINRIQVCHNFYPQPYTGTSLDKFMEITNFWKRKNVKVGAFMSTQTPNSTGPWDVSYGLPTLEMHRNIPLIIQAKHLYILGVDEIIIGNAFASDEELEAICSFKELLVEDTTPIMSYSNKQIGGNIPTRKRDRIPLRVELDSQVTDIEKDIVLNFTNHHESGDGTEYMLRSRFSRLAYHEVSIPIRKYEQPWFSIGDIVVVNDAMRHYKAELQIVMKPMLNDGTRNWVGRIHESEQFLLPYLDASYRWVLYE